MGKTTDRMIVNGVTYEIVDAVSRAQVDNISTELNEFEGTVGTVEVQSGTSANSGSKVVYLTKVEPSKSYELSYDITGGLDSFAVYNTNTDDSDTTIIGYVSSKQGVIEFTTTANVKQIKIYINKTATIDYVFGLSETVSIVGQVEKKLNALTSKIDTFGINELRNGISYNSGNQIINFSNVSPGKTYMLYFQIEGGLDNFDIYNVKTDGTAVTLYGYVQKYEGTYTIQTTSDTSTIRVYIVKTDTIKYSVYLLDQDSLAQQSVLDMYLAMKSTIRKPVKFLILGDSYSDGGGQWVTPMLQEFAEGSSYISLAVTSASLKDKYEDRTQYPYTSRPNSSVNTGNLNTFACQIEKLKRLMAGTDLDPGESQIYATEASYPDVIIIEGGKNDYFDSDAKVETYRSQLTKYVTDVYIKSKSSDTATLGNCYISTPLEEIDRTCFAGAYRYLISELSTLFPNANIFITTVSPIQYHTDNPADDFKVAEQQRLCAEMCSVTLIDWYQDAQISIITNPTPGSGTEDDPYIWNNSSLNSHDSLHVNPYGGKKLAKLTSSIIKQKFVKDMES